MPKALSRPSSYLIVLALLVSTLVVMASPALACHFVNATTPVSTADGFTFEARWTTVNSGNTGITGSVGAGSITWWLIDSYPDGDESTSEPTSHDVGQGVRFVVSGLAPGQSATATFSALVGQNIDCSGANTALLQTTATGTALLATGTAPTFSAVTRTADGFSFTITNFDGDGGYVLATTAGVVSRDGDVVTVSGLAPDTEATVMVTATKDGHTDADDSITGSSLATGTAPTFSAVTRTADGFSFTITNNNPDAVYQLSTTAGTVTRDGDTIIVSGLSANESATVTVTVLVEGATPATETVMGSALAAPTPVVTPASQRAELPATGATTGQLSLLALALLMAGLMSLRVRTRRQARAGLRGS